MTDDLIPLYREMAAGGAQFRGLSLLQSTKAIRKVVKEYGVQTVLDFGSGAGDAYRSPHKVHHEWGLKRASVRLYDPAFPEHNEWPPAGKLYDLVICSDVLEHIPEPEVDAFIATLFGYARKVVWASVCCRPARKCFPGTEINLHCTVQPLEWWAEKFAAASKLHDVVGILVDSP